MKLNGTVAFVTGANRGIGRAFVRHLARAGATRIYAAARNLGSLGELVSAFPAVIPVYLDLTNPRSIENAAAQARDVSLLVNNAGIANLGGVTGAASFDDARRFMEVNYFGLLEMSRAFAPALIANAPSAMINILSIASLMGSPRLGTYAASKAAALSATRTIRAELSPKGVHVLGVMPGYVDTDLTAGLDVEKISADEVATDTFAALDAGEHNVFPGAEAAQVANAFFSNYASLESQLASVS